MTDLHFIAGCCGAIEAGIVHAQQVAGSPMGSATAEKSALCAGRSVPASWVQIEGENGAELGRTRFVICYYLMLSLGENALVAGFRWFLGLRQAGPAAVGAGLAVQFQEGGRGSRTLRARSLSIHQQPKKIFTLPDSTYE